MTEQRAVADVEAAGMTPADLIRLGEKAGIAFQQYRGIGSRWNTTTMGSIPIEKIAAMIDLALFESQSENKRLREAAEWAAVALDGAIDGLPKPESTECMNAVRELRAALRGGKT